MVDTIANWLFARKEKTLCPIWHCLTCGWNITAELKDPAEDRRMVQPKGFSARPGKSWVPQGIRIVPEIIRHFEHGP